MQISILLLLKVPCIGAAEMEKWANHFFSLFEKAITWIFAFSLHLNEAMSGKMNPHSF